MFTGFRFGQSASPGEVTIMSLPAGDVRPLTTLPKLPTDTVPFTGAEPGEVHILPFPMPGDGPVVLPAPGFAPGSIGIPERIAGTEGDDRIDVPTGAVAAGLGGNDVFVLSPGDPAKAGQPLAIITDFGDGDSLDLSKLGANAKILGTEESDRPWGADRVSIDADGDGAEDGFVLLAGKGPDLGGFQPYPMPIVRGELPATTFPAHALFSGGNVGGPIAIAMGEGDGAAGIRLMGDFHTFEGLDLSVV